MSTPAALYYPHTNITDKNIIKNSLLLWDQVEYITPTKKWNHFKFPSKYFNEAIEIISKPHYPTSEERKEVHNKIMALVAKELPDWFFLDSVKNVRNFQTYPIYADKLNRETWMLLEQKLLAKLSHIDYDYHLSPYFGLIIMSLLADSCAGETKRKITDRTEAYAWLQKYTTNYLGGKYITDLDVSQVAPAYERLVTLSIKLLNTDDIPISTLVAMRKREAKSNSADYRNFRRNYLNHVDEFVKRIAKPDIKKSEIEEIERQFKTEMEDDLKDLREELGLEKRKLIFSKEVAVAAAAAAGSLTTPITGLTDLAGYLGAIGVGALYRAVKISQADRKKIMKSHAMSWLYLSEKKASGFDPRKIIL